MKFSTEGLGLAGLDLVPPVVVEIRLDPGEEFFVGEIVDVVFKQIARVLPGRRVSGIATFKDRIVFAKIFYGQGARRNWQREMSGAASMQRSGVRSPALLGSGATADGEGYAVFYNALTDAKGIAETDTAGIFAAVGLLAQLHGANLLQSDAHLDNFVTSNDQVYAVDVGGLRGGNLLRQQFSNLAILLAQRSPLLDGEVNDLWHHYAKVRDAGSGDEYVARMGSAEKMLKLVLRQRRLRVRRYLKKTLRECTQFVQRKNWRRNFLCDRQHWPALQRFMMFPEASFGEGTPLKLGNSATVVRIQLDGESYIVKRYNVKGVVHRIKRWFKRRARDAWCNGHWLGFLGIPTAAPVALLESRVGWFVGVCYLVMVDCGQRNLGELLATDASEFPVLAKQTIEILCALRAAGLTHGDLKSTNFVLSQEGIVLIDYDALRYGPHEIDRKRFMANWDKYPALRQRWLKEMQETANR